jgi:hypothetical protein
LKNRAGDYIHHAYFHTYPGFKMIYQTEIDSAVRKRNQSFELFLDSMMEYDLGIKLTQCEKIICFTI